MAEIYRILLLFLCYTHCLSLQNSCTGRCGQSANSNYLCQCNTACTRYNDCCADYLAVCKSCAGKCNQGYVSSESCQCNDKCSQYGNCCPDYQTSCSTSGSTCLTFDQTVQQMWDGDVNRLGQGDFTLNYQQHVTDASSDLSNNKLFTYLDETKLSGLTYRTFITLLNNYKPTKGDSETVTSTESQEEQAFLDVILQTEVMKTLEDFLTCEHKVNSHADFRQKLHTMWFGLYPRSGSSSTLDTSGFEHVMVGEYKSNTVVNGFHNWISFYEKEKSGAVNYYGYVKRSTVEQNAVLLGTAFSWNGREKDLGSFFVGVSPEFDIAIYSICFFMHPGRSCNFSIESKSFTIKTYSTGGHIATAYASASWSDPTAPVVG